MKGALLDPVSAFTNSTSLDQYIAAFENAFDLLLNPSTRDFNGSIQRASVERGCEVRRRSMNSTSSLRASPPVRS